MNRTRGFIRDGPIVQHKLRKQPRAERDRLDTFPFCPAYDKACCSQRVATVSCVAASATGVSVEHNTRTNVSRTNTNGGTDVNR